MTIKINYEKCCWKDGKCASKSNSKSSCGCSCTGACVGCVEACPVEALRREKRLELDSDKCIGCGACVDACKHGAISLD